MRDSSIAGLAMTLSRDCKLKVTVSGEGSYINGDSTHINIARMENSPLGNMLASGLVFHEISHKNHTDRKKPSGFIGTLTNIIEDIRVEALTIQERPGTRFNLNAVTKHYIEKGKLDPDDLPHAICGKIMAYGRGTLLGQSSILSIEEPCNEMIEDAFGQTFVDEIQGVINGIPKLKDTESVIQMATKIANLLEQQKNNPPPTQPNAQGNAGDSEGGDNQGSNSNQGDPNNGDNTPDESEGSAEGDKNSGDSQGRGDGKDDADGPCAKSGKGSGGPTPQDIDEMLARDDDFGDLSKMIQQEMDAMASGEESIPLLPEVKRMKGNNGKLDEVAAISASSKMRAKMMGMLQDIKRAPVSFGKSGKKIDANRLHKMAIGDARIFKRKIEVEMLNTAIVIALDMSGSMEESAHLSNPCAFAVHHALFGLRGAATCTIMFRSLHNESVNVLVDFKEKPSSEKFNICPNGTTPTDEAIWAARAMLLNRPEPRKILLLVTDGCPDEDTPTIQATKAIQRAGIEIAAIGIDNDSVKDYWQNNRVITKIEELPAAMFGVLDSLLLDKKGYKLQEAA